MFHSFLSNHWRKFLFPLIAISAILALLFIPRGREEKKPILLSEQNSLLEHVIEEPKSDEDEAQTIEEEDSIIIVDVQGAVQFPGVYALTEDDRLIDAIQAAGGYITGADTRLINHALKLEDEMYIYIPMEGEAFEETGEHAVAITSAPSHDSSKSEFVNLNTASHSELMTLPGIGPAKADAIIAYRKETGNFQTIEDLMNISGIGEKTFENLKTYLTVK